MESTVQNCIKTASISLNPNFSSSLNSNSNTKEAFGENYNIPQQNRTENFLESIVHAGES